MRGDLAICGCQGAASSTDFTRTGHDHDARYYTQTQSDARYLPVGGKAADADKLDGKDADDFLQGQGSIGAGFSAMAQDDPAELHLIEGFGALIAKRAAKIAKERERQAKERQKATAEHLAEKRKKREAEERDRERRARGQEFERVACPRAPSTEPSSAVICAPFVSTRTAAPSEFP